MSRIVVLIAGLITSAGAAAYGYEWPLATPPNNSQQGPYPINDTIGAYRDDALGTSGTANYCPAPCAHFHDGTDIAALDNTDVFSVLDGTVTNVTSAFVAIQSVDRILIYFHVFLDQTQFPLKGTWIPAGTFIGQIIPGNGHVHFKETDLGNTIVQNSLRPGGLDNYTNSSPPEVSAPQILDSNVYIANATPLGPVIPSNVTAVDFRAEAHGIQPSPGSSNTGVYQIGYKILNADTGQVASDKNGVAFQLKLDTCLLTV